tara:strand:+ start:104 stop:1507 length:1404 start_codon:yes stop_codon:yes gene_type:complete
MKAVIYARVSTIDQGVNRQIDDLNKWATYKNLEVVKVYQDKISGFKKGFEDRESWNEMIEYVEKNNISNIMVSELSRISRRQVDLIVFVSECSKKGICIHVQKENLITLNEDGSENSNAQMLISIISSMAQQESQSLSYRIKSGRDNAIKNGRGFSTKIYGYEADENGRPTIIEEEAKIVREIFKMACDGIGAPSIVNYLNDKLQDKKWKKGRISSILQNTFYYGKMQYNGVQYDVPKIIPIQQYEQAQSFRESRRRYTSTRQHINPFSGIITCECGSTMHQIVVDKSNLYRCKSKCGVKSINRPFLINEVKIVLERNAKLSKEKTVRDRIKNSIEINNSQVTTNEKRVLKLKGMKDKNYEKYLNEEISQVMYNKFNGKFDIEITKLSVDIENDLKSIRDAKNTLKNEIIHYSDNLEIFKSQILKNLESIVIKKEIAIVKINGWGKQVIILHRGNALIKFNKGINVY